MNTNPPSRIGQSPVFLNGEPIENNPEKQNKMVVDMFWSKVAISRTPLIALEPTWEFGFLSFKVVLL